MITPEDYTDNYPEDEAKFSGERLKKVDDTSPTIWVKEIGQLQCFNYTVNVPVPYYPEDAT